MSDYSSFYLYRKYKITPYGAVDTGIVSLDGEGTMPPVIRQECDPECGCPPPEPIYRWVQTEDTICVEALTRRTSGTPYCTGYNKYVDVTIEESTDGGETWEYAETITILVEALSEDCGYIPIYDKKYQLTLSDSSTVTAECDSTSAITSEEIYNYRSTVRSAIIGECVTTIRGGAFYACTYLTSVTIPDSVTSIGNQAFGSCTSIGSIIIPSSVTEIGAAAFNYCNALESINIPNGITKIDTNTFGQCGRLKSIIIPDTVTNIGDFAFHDCDMLRSCTIGSGVTSIGKEAFYRCRSLTSVTIPDSVTSIGNSAFYGCSGATSLTIGSGITGIDSKAFQYCRALSSITIKATTPPTLGTIGSGVFYYTNNCPIYVPAASVDAYKSASSWSKYISRIQAIP